MNGPIRFALGLAGFSEADVVEIEKALPAVDRLLDAVKKLEPDVAKLMPDLLAAIPAAKIVIAHLQKE